MTTPMEWKISSSGEEYGQVELKTEDKEYVEVKSFFIKCGVKYTSIENVSFLSFVCISIS